jgi:MFS family permease
MLLFGIVFLSLGAVLTFIRQHYGLSELSVGSLTALLPLGVLAGSLVFGPVVDRYGYRQVLVVSTLIIFFAFEGIAFAGSLVVLQLAFLLIGFGGGVINGATNALVADISTESKGANLSLLGVFYGIGAVGMPVLLATLSGIFSYASIVAGIGFFVLLPFVFFLILRFPAPKQAHGISLKKILKTFSVLLLLLGMVLFFESAMEGIMNNWTTSFAGQKLGMDNAAALTALTLLNIALMVSRLVLGWLLKKSAPQRVLFAGLGCILAGALCLAFSSGISGLYVGVALIGLGFGPGFPVVLGYVGELYPAFTGTAFSVVITLALFGNTLLNGIVGVVSQRYGILGFPWIMAICAVLMMGVFGWSLARMRKQG